MDVIGHIGNSRAACLPRRLKPAGRDQDAIPKSYPQPSQQDVRPASDKRTETGKPFLSRSYQLEMLEESLKRNIIVAMDTGSGKTHVAVLRIKKEIEIMAPGKLIWFLTPTVTLCEQQLGCLRTQIASVHMKSFTSKDNVDRWTDKAHWDAVLAGVSVVVSTYAVLHDALCHAFVEMKSLALLVFDEVHGCTKKSPGSKIMRDFYKWNKDADKPVPHILGLTATAAANLQRLDVLEGLMDSVCKSPILQRQELSSHVNRPDMERAVFNEEDRAARIGIRNSANLALLRDLYRGLPVSQDQHLLRTGIDSRATYRLQSSPTDSGTSIRGQVNTLIRTAERIQAYLGSWASDAYISLAVQNTIRSASRGRGQPLHWEVPEKQHLSNMLSQLNLPPQIQPDFLRSTSDKARALVDSLVSCCSGTRGIVFAKERATVHMIFCLLSHHPGVCNLFRLGIIVGQSNSPKKNRGICDSWNVEDHAADLEKFRTGDISLLVATSVVEEGIDVPRCDLVICFDEPATLISYVQRRGRARMQHSRYIILFDQNSRDQKRDWESLEQRMKTVYETEGRETRPLSEVEEIDESRGRQFRAGSTDALLDLDNAKAHLQCFCSRLSSRYQPNMQPVYIIQEEDGPRGPEDQPLVSSTVFLPPSVPISPRAMRSKENWYSAKSASKDAAFEACIALYNAKLLNESFLPLLPDEEMADIRAEDSIIEISEQVDPWPAVAHAWETEQILRGWSVVLSNKGGSTMCEMEMHTPVDFLPVKAFQVFWDASTEWIIKVGPPKQIKQRGLGQNHTTTLLRLAFGHRWEVEDGRHLVLFSARGRLIPAWDRLVGSLDDNDRLDEPTVLLRDVQGGNHPYLFQKRLSSKPSEHLIQCPSIAHGAFPVRQTFIALRRWSKRSDFLHKVDPCPKPDLLCDKEFYTVLPQKQMGRELLPMVFTQFGLLVPSILHKIEVQLVVTRLRDTMLQGVQIAEPELLRSAISAPSSREGVDYQILEFWGDSVLKFIVSVFLMSKHPHWPEGYLSKKRALLVCKLRLCTAAVGSGLDKFILTKPFTGKNWRPQYVESVREECGSQTREASSKTVADVVEALIGAGWKMGGYDVSLSIAKAILPEIELPSIEVGREKISAAASSDEPVHESFRLLELLAGYTFRNKSLLVQAMTHCSDIKAPNSYERLEFLGDAILETIIMQELAKSESDLSPSVMHLYRAALVNRDYLSFIALEWSISEKTVDLQVDARTGRVTEVASEVRYSLGSFLRHGAAEVGDERLRANRRHAEMRHDIRAEIEAGLRYPWVLLSRLRANKFFADIVESLLAAVWVDSGSIDTCRQVVAKMGVLDDLHRMVRSKTIAMHPKEKLSILSRSQEVKFTVQKADDVEEWSCVVCVGESKVAAVAGCKSENEAKVTAADMAVISLDFQNAD